MNPKKYVMALEALVEEVGAPRVIYDPTPTPRAENTFVVEWATAERILSELPSNGPIIINGELYFLYISQGVLGNLPKFHFMNCSTIKSMNTAGRLRRYVFTNRSSGLFKMIITSERFSHDGIEQDMRLEVCKNCLSEWQNDWGNSGYKGYNSNWPEEKKSNAVKTFDITEFLNYFRELSDSRFFPAY